MKKTNRITYRTAQPEIGEEAEAWLHHLTALESDDDLFAQGSHLHRLSSRRHPESMPTASRRVTLQKK